MEDHPGSMLSKIAAVKNMLDQANEEIELKIQQTREIESEVVQCSKKESDLLRKEDDLIKIVNAKESKLNDLMIVLDVSKRGLEEAKEILAYQEKSRDEVALRINTDRDDFINICRQFQLNVESNGKAEVYMKFLLKKEDLMGRIAFHKKEIKEQCVQEEDNVVKFQSLGHGKLLQEEIFDGTHENEKLLKDIDGLKTALQDVNDFKEISWMQSQIDANEEEKRQLEDCILGYQIQLSRLLANDRFCGLIEGSIGSETLVEEQNEWTGGQKLAYLCFLISMIHIDDKDVIQGKSTKKSTSEDGAEGERGERGN